MSESYLEPEYDTMLGHASPWQDVCPACGHRLIRGFVACGQRGRSGQAATNCSCKSTEPEEIVLPELTTRRGGVL